MDFFKNLFGGKNSDGSPKKKEYRGFSSMPAVLGLASLYLCYLGYQILKDFGRMGEKERIPLTIAGIAFIVIGVINLIRAIKIDKANGGGLFTRRRPDPEDDDDDDDESETDALTEDDDTEADEEDIEADVTEETDIPEEEAETEASEEDR